MFAQVKQRARVNRRRYGVTPVSDVDDFEQTAWVRILEEYDRFDPELGSLEAFIACRADGAIVDELRRSYWKGRSRVDRPQVSISAPRTDSQTVENLLRVEDNVERVELADYVQQVAVAVRRLGWVDRLVLCLHVSGVAERVIGESFGVSESRISQRLRAVRSRLRRITPTG